jgi:hypothetical protein
MHLTGHTVLRMLAFFVKWTSGQQQGVFGWFSASLLRHRSNSDGVMTG